MNSLQEEEEEEEDESEKCSYEMSNRLLVGELRDAKKRIKQLEKR